MTMKREEIDLINRFYLKSIQGQIKLEKHGISDSSNEWIIDVKPTGNIDFMGIQKANDVLLFISIILQNYQHIFEILTEQKAMVYRDDIRMAIAEEFKNLKEQALLAAEGHLP